MQSLYGRIVCLVANNKMVYIIMLVQNFNEIVVVDVILSEIYS